MRAAAIFAILISLPAGVARADGAKPDEPRSFAHANRLAFSLGFGVGTVSQGGFQTLAEDMETVFTRQGATLSDTPASGTQLGAEFSIRYYFPLHIMAQVGFATLYNYSDVDAQAGAFRGSVSNHNVVMEVPVLVGAYFPVARRVGVYAAAGPSKFFFSRSYWDADPGSVTDFRSDGGMGFHLLGGADLFANKRFSIGFELRYRSMKGDDLRELDSGIVVTQGALLGGASAETYTVDHSGVSINVNLRLFAL